MSSFVLKIIALVSMLCDHAGYIIFSRFSFMNYIGRLAFPIFAFQITEGYEHTSNLKKYFYRLFIFAIISQVPYMLFINIFSNSFCFNILFTLILGLIAITVYEKTNNKLLGVTFVIFSAIAAQLLNFDHGCYGITIIFIFHILKNKKLLLNLFFIIATCEYYLYNFFHSLDVRYMYIILFTCISLIPINLYNQKKGKNIKYFLYIFYPLHLILLYFLNFVI